MVLVWLLVDLFRFWLVSFRLNLGCFDVCFVVLVWFLYYGAGLSDAECGAWGGFPFEFFVLVLGNVVCVFDCCFVVLFCLNV